MPLIYRRTPDGRGSAQDVEEDIVLSELVRGTGEASRLRRRGALRVDRVYAVVNRPSRWEVFVPHENQDSSQPSLALPFPVAPPLDLNRDEHDEYTYVLRCGGGSLDSHLHDYLPSTSPFLPSVLPLYPPRSSPPPKSRHRPSAKQSTNGCGAIIHTKAAPRPKLGMWTAKTEASDSVVHLDPCYFDSAAVGKMVRSVCGCVREGVGCAVCGNPLGTLYTPCKSATDGVFFSPPRSMRPSQGQPPQTQPQQTQSPSSLTSSSSQPHSPKLHVYSFFATAVSSHPPYKFPSPSTSSSSNVGTVPPRHPYPVPASSASLQPPTRLPYPGGAAITRLVPPNPNLFPTVSYPSPPNRTTHPNPNPAISPLPLPLPNANVNPNVSSSGNVHPGIGYYPYPFSHVSYDFYNNAPNSYSSVRGMGVDPSIFSREEAEVYDDGMLGEEEEEDMSDEDEDEGEVGDEEEGVMTQRQTRGVNVRAPRMRRTFSRVGDGQSDVPSSNRFFFGRRYATASPIPLSDAVDENVGSGEGVNDGGHDGGQDEGEEEGADEGADEEDDEGFTLDEEEYEYDDSSPDISPRLLTRPIQQDEEGHARPSSSASSSSDKAEST